MSTIISPLDNILNTVNDLIKSNQSGRRGSSLQDAFDSIIQNVNDAKNNIIKHFVEKNSKLTYEKSDINYATAVKNKRNLKNNIIIPIANNIPDKSTAEKFESRIFNILEDKKSTATVLKTSTTDKCNLVINFKHNDNIDEIKNLFSNEFGNKVKVVKPFLPKIKIVSVPATFDTNNKDNIIKSITECNETLKNEFLLNKDCMEFLFSYNVNGNKTLIIKCSPKVRNLLKNSGDKAVLFGNDIHKILSEKLLPYSN